MIHKYGKCQYLPHIGISARYASLRETVEETLRLSSRGVVSIRGQRLQLHPVVAIHENRPANIVVIRGAVFIDRIVSLKEQWFPAEHPAIIDRKLWDAVHAIL